MKNLAYSLLALVGLLWSCQSEKINIGMPLEVDQLDWTYQETETQNVFAFQNNTPEVITHWDFGNGQKAEGVAATTQYPFAGDYTVKMTVLAQGGSTVDSVVISVAQDNMTLLDDPLFEFLTGGADNLDGKTWVLDSTRAGHMGVGETTADFGNWWNAAPMDKAGLALYDDKVTFTLVGSKYEYENNGRTYANGGVYADLGGEAVAEPDGGDFIVKFPVAENLTWGVSFEGDKKFITFPNGVQGGFICYYAGAPFKYEVLDVNENELLLRQNVGWGAWFFRLVREGYVPPVEEEVKKPIQAEDITDAFDGEGNIAWDLDAVNFWGGYDNPRIHGANTSMRVAKYERDASQQFGNVQTTLEYRMDLSERNIITLKAYFPSYNDYTTEDADAAPWMPYKNLQMQVAVKLQDSTNAAPWETQHEVIQMVDVTDEWVELTFDFSDSADAEEFIYDKIVLQIGGEGQHLPGTFFIDDFMLE